MMPLFALLLAAATKQPAESHPPETFHDLGQSWHADIVDFVRSDVPKLVVILLMAFVLQYIVTFFVKRMRRIADAYPGTQRASQLRTMAAILRATCYGLIGFIALLQILQLFNIDLKPLLASAGVVGLGISFGAQSMFKDMLNGVFILVEDQFNVGDVVTIAGLTGTVEDLTLRSTTLRSGDGTLNFIPNSQIATVSNLSREYSVATLNVAVDASADPDRVMAVLKTVAMEVRKDDEFQDVAIADPDILGVDKINGREVIYPVNIRVKANKKDPILRALRRRVLLAFDKEGIPLGLPTTSTVVMQAKGDPTLAQPPVSITGN
ncbi:mechanosensitive ion channel family protein [Terriglobus sp. RCC_193]|uniref:mechanosensitive ion channel family protein n=1 Tax=Terriglobus sp. RCC_193 TaxID=3239218 RepID=UPI003526BC58